LYRLSIYETILENSGFFFFEKDRDITSVVTHNWCNRVDTTLDRSHNRCSISSWSFSWLLFYVDDLL